MTITKNSLEGVTESPWTCHLAIRLRRMCDFGRGHDHPAFGFLVDCPEIRALVEETRQLTATIADTAVRVEALKPAFAKLLAAEGWLPDEYASPDFTSGMGSGIGQYALYRAGDGSLTLFSLVIPSGAETPIHDHLAWGLIGVYRGRQSETVYRRLDDGRDQTAAVLEVSRTQDMDTGQFYSLLPPLDDIHYVKTLSTEPSVSIHLLANDTACVWRHRFEPSTGVVTPFRSGYSNAPCPPDPAAADA
jgi:3-mercaptopropionate dioxygenase